MGAGVLTLLFLLLFSASDNFSIRSKLVDLALQPLICGQALCNLNINGCIGLRWLKFESKVLSRLIAKFTIHFRIVTQSCVNVLIVCKLILISHFLVSTWLDVAFCGYLSCHL